MWTLHVQAQAGSQSLAHLLLMEMGISSNTSRQDTSAPLSFSAVSAPVL